MNKRQKEEELANRILNCKRCELWKSRKNPLIADGNTTAQVMIVGEAPGFNEDIHCKAFIGRSGKILDEMLSILGLSRNDIYITNILKCHPPNNQKPTRDQINSCIGYLYQQIDMIRPKSIIMLGRYASEEICKKYKVKFNGITKDHGKIFRINTLIDKIKLMPCYHPAAACYDPGLLDVIRNDLLKAKDELS